MDILADIVTTVVTQMQKPTLAFLIGGMMLAALTQEDLGVLADLLESGDLKPVIDRHYPLEAIAEALL